MNIRHLLLMDKESFKGLSYHQAKQLLEEYGENSIETKGTVTAWSILFSQFPTVINGILLIAALFSLLINNILDGFFILAIIIINAILGFFQEYRAQKSLEKLKDLTSPLARVIRDGKEVRINASELVPGDLVVLTEGDRVPADGEIIDVAHIEINESILTGESLAVMKNLSETVYLGTLVIKGKGIMQVTKTGMHTQFGQIAETLATIQEEKAPLQKNLDQLGKTLSYSVLVVGFFIIVIGLMNNQDLVPLILVSASIAVAAIPEGLPAVVTIAFAVGTHRMAKRGAIVRKMAAVETLGAVSVIISDKTGTITRNIMRVKKHWIKHEDKLPLLIKACVLGNTASLIEKGSGKSFEVLGDQTDGALLMWANEQKIKPDLPKDSSVVDEYVFDTENKTITTVWKKDGKNHVFVRGAPEVIIAKCALSKELQEEAYAHVAEFAKEGLRTIGFAAKTDEQKKHVSREHLEQDLTFLGCMGIYDPPRNEVKDAVIKSRQAGISTIMVTGDNELTALALAKEINLIEKDEDVITGDELAKMSDEELSQLITRTRIFARTKPEQKLRIVTVLKNLGLVVGVTGDGVNDALALQKADVGIAMGQGGTDVAKEAADIVLTDNNFATLIKAVEEGRIIYKNISNAILYLLSGNLAEISIVFIATFLQLPFPLLPTQILWINLVTDSFPALALATGSKDATVLENKPRNPKTPILSFSRVLLIAAIGYSLTALLLVIFIFLLNTSSEAFARTVVFNMLIYFHLLIAIGFGWQTLRRGNYFLVITIFIILLLQILITYTPFFRNIFHLALQ